MIKKLDVYLLKYFLTTLVVVVFSFGLTFIIINIIEELRDFIDHQVPLLQVLEYYFYFGGWVIKSFLPMFIMLSVLFSISILSNKNEILAMKASGISLYRISAPILVMVLLLSAGHFYYNEYLFPPANKKRLEIKNFTIEKKSKRSFSRMSNLKRQISPGSVYSLGSFNLNKTEGMNLKLYKREKNEIVQLLTAERLVYKDYQWLAINGQVRNFQGESFTFYEFDTLTIPEIEDKPRDLAKKLGKPEDMGYDELKEYIELLKRTGSPYVRESIDLKLKYAFPISSFIVVLLCIPYAVNTKKGGVAVSLSTGAFISLIYFVAFKILQSMGYNEKIPEVVAVWGINAIFLLIGLTFMIKARK